MQTYAMKVQSTDNSRIALIDALRTPALRPAFQAETSEGQGLASTGSLESAAASQFAAERLVAANEAHADPGEWLLSLDAWSDIAPGARAPGAMSDQASSDSSHSPGSACASLAATRRSAANWLAAADSRLPVDASP